MKMLKVTVGLVIGLICFSSVEAYCRDNQASFVFDVAVIRLSQPNQTDLAIQPLPGGNGYSVHNAPVKKMIALAYGLPTWQIKGGPSWAGADHGPDGAVDRYDIEAKTDHKDSIDHLHLMFQNLLADRFSLRMHKETHKGRIYALSTDIHGSKMKVNEDPQDMTISIKPHNVGVFVGTGVSIPLLCRWLGDQLREEERPVVDKTGLDQTYNFVLSFDPPNFLEVEGEKVNRPETMNLPSLFEALKTQLGLRLREEEGDVEYYVIDHIAKPSPN